VLMEARMVLPFMRNYAMPTRFAVLNFRCDPCLVPHAHQQRNSLTVCHSYPVCSLTSALSDDGPPFLTYANAAFTRLIGRSWVRPRLDSTQPYSSLNNPNCASTPTGRAHRRAVPGGVCSASAQLQEGGPSDSEPVLSVLWLVVALMNELVA
jgi:hypothetical protein